MLAYQPYPSGLHMLELLGQGANLLKTFGALAYTKHNHVTTVVWQVIISGSDIIVMLLYVCILLRTSVTWWLTNKEKVETRIRNAKGHARTLLGGKSLSAIP